MPKSMLFSHRAIQHVNMSYRLNFRCLSWGVEAKVLNYNRIEPWDWGEFDFAGIFRSLIGTIWHFKKRQKGKRDANWRFSAPSYVQTDCILHLRFIGIVAAILFCLMFSQFCQAATDVYIQRSYSKWCFCQCVPFFLSILFKVRR